MSYRLVDLTNPININIEGGLNLTGDYDAETAYQVGDVVSYEGASYVATQNTTGNALDDAIQSSAAKVIQASNAYILSGSWYRYANAPATLLVVDGSNTYIYSVGAGTGAITWGDPTFTVDGSGNVTATNLYTKAEVDALISELRDLIGQFH
jgi:hypothetical protein